MRADLPAAALLGDGAGPGGLPGHLHHALQVERLQVQPTTPSRERTLLNACTTAMSRFMMGEQALLLHAMRVCHWHVCVHQDAFGC